MIARGTIHAARGGLLEASLPGADVGLGVRIQTRRGVVSGVVTALAESRALIAPHDAIDGVACGDSVCVDPAVLTLPLGTVLLGRTVDARGIPIDDGPAPRGRLQRIAMNAPSPRQRTAVTTPFWTGVRTIDGLLTIGRGARIGIFGPPGAGKSTLLHLLMRGSHADAVVVGLVGERGREAEEWMRIAPSYASIICATSDRSAAERVRAAHVSIAQASALRSRGLHVLLILDSFARFGAALRELAVANGESVGRGGYPPSVFALLACFAESAGTADRGSITLVATVLSDGDERDPISESARSLLDGHIQLSPSLANAGRFPAIDVLSSASRTMSQVVEPRHLNDARAVRIAISALSATEDARSLGLQPAQPSALRALAAEDAIERFLRQGERPEPSRVTLSALSALADTLR